MNIIPDNTFHEQNILLNDDNRCKNVTQKFKLIGVSRQETGVQSQVVSHQKLKKW